MLPAIGLGRQKSLGVSGRGLVDPYAGRTKFYVRKTGNDTTGNGSSASPWLTIDKAHLAANSGNVIYIGPGIYAENTSAKNYFWLYRTFANWVTFVAEDYNNPPVITGTGATNASMVGNTAGTYYEFNHIKFDGSDVAAGKNAIINLAFGNNARFKFDNCSIVMKPATSTRYGLISDIGNGLVGNSLILNNCTFSQTNTLSNSLSFSVGVGTGAFTGTLTNLTLTNCTATGDNCLRIDAVTNLLVDGGNYQASVGYALLLGVDGSVSRSLSGVVQNVYAKSISSHAVLVGGAGSNGVTVEGSTIIGGNQGLVAKESTNVTIRNNNISHGIDNALYCKAAKNVTLSGNTISNSVGRLFRVGWNSSTGNNCENINFQNNSLVGSGTSGLLAWDSDSGGGVCDYNTYNPGGSVAYGNVRADAAVASLEELRAAWIGYGDGSNDSHSIEI